MTTDADITRLRAEFQQDLARLSSASDLQSLRDKYLGRKNGLVTALVKSVASAPADLKPVLGKGANELKQEIEQQLSERKAALEATKAPAGAVDISLPGRAPRDWASPSPDHRPRSRLKRSSRAWATRCSKVLKSKTTTTTSKRSTCRPSILRATCRTRCISPERLPASAARRRCSARTPRRCRSGTWRATSLQCESSCPARSTAATIST